MNRNFITKDGSTTLYSETFQQYYHNPNGAVSESLHIFFAEPGIPEFLKSATSITILEVGFGTGLNFILLLDLCLRNEIQIPIHFYSVEAFPVEQSTARSFDFKTHLKNTALNDELPRFFKDLKRGVNSFTSSFYPTAELHLFYGTFDQFETPGLQADFIFHDPFSPAANKELWTDSVFYKLANHSKNSVMLSTYSSASSVRGAMSAAGWKVARAPGTLGKREMTLAALDENQLHGFKRVNEKKLAERYVAGDFK